MSHLASCDIIPLINGLSDHDAQLVIIKMVQKQNKVHQTYLERKINKHRTADFQLNLRYETVYKVSVKQSKHKYIWCL